MFANHDSTGELKEAYKRGNHEGIEHVICSKTSEDRLWIKLQANFFGLDKDVF